MDGALPNTISKSTTSEPWQLRSLTFDSVEDYRAYRVDHGGFLGNIWLWHERLGDREGPFSVPGICDICGKMTEFEARSRPTPDDPNFTYRTWWWQSMSCTHCGLECLERSVARALIDHCGEDDSIYHVGQFSNLRKRLGERFSNLVSSQFQTGRTPGEVENGVRYEDLTQLSFEDGSHRAIVNTEVLEHIPDYKKALCEMARVLEPGGHVVMTFPWLCSDNYEHLTRAEMLPDGTINHILPPEYHGDPASKEEVLSFRVFGWKILDEMRECGFSNAHARFTFGPLHGYMAMQTPVIVGIR